MTDPAVKSEVLARLKNVRGHIAGIERMLEEDQPCSSLLVQIAAHLREGDGHTGAGDCLPFGVLRAHAGPGLGGR